MRRESSVVKLSTPSNKERQVRGKGVGILTPVHGDGLVPVLQRESRAGEVLDAAPNENRVGIRQGGDHSTRLGYQRYERYLGYYGYVSVSCSGHDLGTSSSTANACNPRSPVCFGSSNACNNNHPTLGTTQKETTKTTMSACHPLLISGFPFLSLSSGHLS